MAIRKKRPTQTNPLIKMRGVRVRAYLSRKQQALFLQWAGCDRFVYNWGIERSGLAYKAGEKMNPTILSRELTLLKEDKTFLATVPDTVIRQSLLKLDTAFTNFFNKSLKAKYPKFKKRRNEKSITYQIYNVLKNVLRFDGYYGYIKCGKEMGEIKFRHTRDFAGRPTMVTLKSMPNGEFYLSFMTEELIRNKRKNKKSVGIDLGLKTLAVGSDDDEAQNIRSYKKHEKRLKRLSRRFSKCSKGSYNWHKRRLQIAKLHDRIKQIRHTCLHLISNKLVNKNQVICLEDLNVAGMVKNKHLAKSILDAGMGLLTQQLVYKSDWYGRTVIKVDRFFPSTKLCHCCGYKNDLLTLKDRQWQCPDCGKNHDRDKNAATNILREGFRQYREEHGVWPAGIVPNW